MPQRSQRQQRLGALLKSQDRLLPSIRLLPIRARYWLAQQRVETLQHTQSGLERRHSYAYPHGDSYSNGYGYAHGDFNPVGLRHAHGDAYAHEHAANRSNRHAHAYRHANRNAYPNTLPSTARVKRGFG